MKSWQKSLCALTLTPAELSRIKTSVECAGERQPIRADVYIRDVTVLMERYFRLLTVFTQATDLLTPEQLVSLFKEH